MLEKAPAISLSVFHTFLIVLSLPLYQRLPSFSSQIPCFHHVSTRQHEPAAQSRASNHQRSRQRIQSMQQPAQLLLASRNTILLRPRSRAARLDPPSPSLHAPHRRKQRPKLPHRQHLPTPHAHPQSAKNSNRSRLQHPGREPSMGYQAVEE